MFRRLKSRLKELVTQADFNKKLAGENFDKYLRALADLDNSRKRMAKEYIEKEAEANRNLIAKLLPVLDNLERALAQAEKSECANESCRTFIQGVEMIDGQFRKLLEAEGLRHFESKGEEFDPVRHHAILAIATDQHPPNTVMDEVEKGFLFNNKVLRPARVTVSKSSQPQGIGDISGDAREQEEGGSDE